MDTHEVPSRAGIEEQWKLFYQPEELGSDVVPANLP